jgi:alternate F1F0 ATPase F1 subunit gamma
MADVQRALCQAGAQIPSDVRERCLRNSKLSEADSAAHIAGGYHRAAGNQDVMCDTLTSLRRQLDGAGKLESAQVYVFHNRPQSAALYEPMGQRLLPLDAQWHARLTDIQWPTSNRAEALGGAGVTLRALVHEHLFISLYKACAESLTSENGSRLEAMQRAQQNIETLCAHLQQSFNRRRQSSIDEELFDVIAGFNALSTGR